MKPNDTAIHVALSIMNLADLLWKLLKSCFIVILDIGQDNSLRVHPKRIFVRYSFIFLINLDSKVITVKHSCLGEISKTLQLPPWGLSVKGMDLCDYFFDLDFYTHICISKQSHSIEVNKMV
jgi:hypothetical protein